MKRAAIKHCWPVDPRSLRVRVLEYLEQHRGRWVTCSEIVAALGAKRGSVAAILSREHNWGRTVEMQEPQQPHWRMP